MEKFYKDNTDQAGKLLAIDFVRYFHPLKGDILT